MGGPHPSVRGSERERGWGALALGGPVGTERSRLGEEGGKVGWARGG
jgi:hypothetical protein